MIRSSARTVHSPSLSCLLLAALLPGCMSYAPGSPASSARVLENGEPSRQVQRLITADANGHLLVSVRREWEQRLEVTTVSDGEYEVESFFNDAVLEEDGLDCLFWGLTVGWLALPADLVAVILTGPVAVVQHLISDGTDVSEAHRATSEPVSEVGVTVTCGAWRVSKQTDPNGEAAFELRIPALGALQAGGPLSYRLELEGQPAEEWTLTLEQTLACADPPPGSAAERAASWRTFARQCPPAIGDAIEQRLERQRKAAEARARAEEARAIARREQAARDAAARAAVEREQAMRACACAGTGYRVLGYEERYGVGHRLVPQRVYVVSGSTSLPYTERGALATKRVRFTPDACPECRGANRVADPPAWDHR